MHESNAPTPDPTAHLCASAPPSAPPAAAETPAVAWPASESAAADRSRRVGAIAERRATHRGILDYVFIIPSSHLRVFDWRWQLTAYDVFHVGNFSRNGHILFMTPVLLGAFILTAHLSPVASVSLAVVLAVWWMWFDLRVGLAAVPLLVALWSAGCVLAESFGSGAGPLALTVIGVSAALVAASHLREGIPPPWSGCDHFVPLSAWRRTRPWYVLGPSLALLSGSGVLYEIWASFRYVPVHLLQLLERFGYQAPYRPAVRLRAAAACADITVLNDRAG